MKALRFCINLLLISILFYLPTCFAEEVFRVQSAKQGSVFVINNNRFTARDYCSNIKRGDPVQFTEGSPNGYCISGVFINLRTGGECSVWCH